MCQSTVQPFSAPGLPAPLGTARGCIHRAGEPAMGNEGIEQVVKGECGLGRKTSMGGGGHGNVQGEAQTLASPAPPPEAENQGGLWRVREWGVQRRWRTAQHCVLLSPVYAVLLAEHCVNVFHTWSMKI